MYETIDLKGAESAFDTFPTFKMYKIKRLTSDGLNSIASGLTSQDITEELCKQNIKLYHDGAMDRKTMSDGARKAFAEFTGKPYIIPPVYPKSKNNTKKKLDKNERSA